MTAGVIYRLHSDKEADKSYIEYEWFYIVFKAKGSGHRRGTAHSPPRPQSYKLSLNVYMLTQASVYRLYLKQTRIVKVIIKTRQTPDFLSITDTVKPGLGSLSYGQPPVIYIHFCWHHKCMLTIIPHIVVQTNWWQCQHIGRNLKFLYSSSMFWITTTIYLTSGPLGMCGEYDLSAGTGAVNFCVMQG